ncbi:MAG: M20/M25/M40 family metallo-hydrolase, partial [Myxococcales bacterium]|nr:M20/M25/M40 family metallo-hydrolase [Myxococcales bacterium]
IDVPVVQLRGAVAAELLASQGIDLAQTQDALEAWQGPRGAALPVRARLKTRLDALDERSANVLAAIPGTDLAGEVVVLGGHWDHVGTSDEGMCTPLTRDAPDGREVDTICNGADDNASGTATVLALAQSFAAAGVRPRRTIVFAHFGAEEVGLIGSQALVRDWPERFGAIHSMVNVDMVGRLSSVGLVIEGGGSSESWPALVGAIDYADLT